MAVKVRSDLLFQKLTLVSVESVFNVLIRRTAEKENLQMTIAS